MTAKVDDAQYRRGVGILLLNDRGDVLVARRIDMPFEAWQMPQGGINDGEEARVAAFRELKEEIGTEKVEVVGESKGWLRYDLPPELAERAWGGRWRGQCQKWFVMRFTGTDEDINLQTEHAEFSTWKWVSLQELPDLVVSFKRQLYVDLLAEFPDLHHGFGRSLSDLLADPLVRMTMAADSVSEAELFALLGRASERLRTRRDQPLRDMNEAAREHK